MYTQVTLFFGIIPSSGLMHKLIRDLCMLHVTYPEQLMIELNDWIIVDVQMKQDFRIPLI